MNRPVERLLSRLDKVKGKYPKYMARCPAHEDNGPSLSITAKDDGRILIHCFAGCGASDVMDSLGMRLSDLFPEGSVGDFSNKKHMQHENTLTQSGYQNMQSEIQRLRAKVGA